MIPRMGSSASVRIGRLQADRRDIHTNPVKQRKTVPLTDQMSWMCGTLTRQLYYPARDH